MQKSRLKRAYFKEFGEKKCELASTSATGVVIIGSEEAIATSTEGEKKDNPKNAASTTTIGIIV